MRLIHPSIDNCIQRDRVTYTAWGAALTLEQYLSRELKLRAHPWSHEGMQTWFLTGTQGEALSSCETFRMDSRLCGRAGHFHGVASVFTEPAYRGKGYASQMLRGVIEELRASDPGFQGMILFSEVGDRIYERLGFEVIESLEWRVELGQDLSGSGFPVNRLRADSPAAAECLSAYHELPLEFHVQPRLSQLDWHWERARVYAALLGRELPAFEVLSCGRGYSFWMADYKNNKLRALLFVAHSEDEWLGMAGEAAAECRRLGLADIAIWDTSRVASPELKTSLLKRLGIRLAPREDELTMVYFSQGRPARPWNEAPRALWI